MDKRLDAEIEQRVGFPYALGPEAEDEVRTLFAGLGKGELVQRILDAAAKARAERAARTPARPGMR